MAGSLLVSGNPQHYKAIGEGGQPVYSVAFQLREAIRLKAGAEVADCLAIPQPKSAWQCDRLVRTSCRRCRTLVHCECARA